MDVLNIDVLHSQYLGVISKVRNDIVPWSKLSLLKVKAIVVHCLGVGYLDVGQPIADELTEERVKRLLRLRVNVAADRPHVRKDKDVVDAYAQLIRISIPADRL